MNISKKFVYLKQLYDLKKDVDNWYLIFSLFVHPQDITLKLKSGSTFRINSYLDALTVKEIFIEDDYNIYKLKLRTVIDIGGNIGTFSILAAQNNHSAKVFTYEPVKSTYQRLCDNVTNNKIKNVFPINRGVGAKKGKSRIYKNKRSGLSSLVKERPGSVKETISLTTLSDIFRDNRIKSCDFLKVDCEGAEYDIFFTTKKSVLDKIKRMAIEYHDSLTDHNHTKLSDFLTKKGFKVKVVKHPLEDDIGIIFAHK